MLRAIVADDEELAVERLVMILSELDEIEICHFTSNPWETYHYAKHHPVDIAFLDIEMPELDGMRLSGMLQDVNPYIDTVFVTGYDEYAVRAFEMCALDYLMKPVTNSRLSAVLGKLRKRERKRAGQRAMPEPMDRLEVAAVGNELLTEQEMKVLILMLEGLTNKEIAARLNNAPETVKWHIKNVYRKLDVGNRVQLLRRANELKIW